MCLRRPTSVVSLPRRLSRFVRLLRQIVVMGAVVSSPALAAGTEDHSYRLVLGDRISIVVFGQAELSGDQLVDGSGNVRWLFRSDRFLERLSPDQLLAAIAAPLRE